MTLDGYVYYCSAGETFDSVALAIFGDEKYAAELMNANPGLCNLVVFVGGEVIWTPVIDIPSEGKEGAQSVAPWKEG